MISFQKIKKKNGNRNCLHRFKDIKKLVENAEAGIILDTVDIFEIKAQLMAMVDLNSYLLKNKEVFSNFVLKDMNELFKILDPNDEKNSYFFIFTRLIL